MLDDRTVLFVDGANLHATIRLLGWELDYTRLISYLGKSGRMLRPRYYTAINENFNETNQLKPVLDYLAYNGWQIVSKPLKDMRNSDTGVVTRKGNMDIEIAVDMILMAPYVDHFVLASGDGDFKRPCEALQMMGKRITVLSTTQGTQRVLSDDLRRQADQFLDLELIKAHIARDATERVKAGLNPRPKEPATG